jgi:hypothetical protein
MAKKVNVIGAKPKRVRLVDQPIRRIEPAELAAALGAEPCAERLGANLDPISLAELGTELQRRLRSSGGRPALTDATEFCRVPLSKEDVKALEDITDQIEEKTGTKPSLGQVVSVIVRDYLAPNFTKPSELRAILPRSEERKERMATVSAWLPRLAEIINEANAVHKAASTIENAVKQIEEDVEKAGKGEPEKGPRMETS